jgi:cytochrome o ubiquinol oxidase subunit 1
MPSNTMVPAMIGLFAFGFGFGMVWRIWWMAAGSMLAIIGLVIIRSFQRTPGYMLQPAEIAAMERRTSASDIIAEQPSRPPLVEAEAH